MSIERPAAGNEQEKVADLVFQGGGVKGIGLVGAYSVLEERGYRPVNMAGASAGAIVAALVAAGYSAKDLYRVMKEVEFGQFEDRAWEDRFLTFVSVPLSIIKDKGIYEGNRFYEWIKEKLLENLQNETLRGEELTFGDLVRDDLPNDLPEELYRLYRYRLQVIVSDTTEQRMVVLPRDADKLGIQNPDDLSVAQAVRMSMGIPLYFEPVRHWNPENDREHLLVDGGMLSNFPVWLFDAPENRTRQRPTFGLKLVKKAVRDPIVNPDSALDVPDAVRSKKPGRLTTLGYLWNLVSTMMEAHDRLYIEQKKFEQTIDIATLGVRTTEFNLSDERKDELYESGREAAIEFLNEFESK